MRRLLFTGFVLASLAAGAQTSTLLTPLQIRTATDETKDTYTFGAADCHTTLTARWRVNSLIGTPSSSLHLWATQGECGTAPASGDVSYTDASLIVVQQYRTDTFAVALGELPGFNVDAADGGIACGTLGVQITHRICGEIDTFSYTTTTQQKFSQLNVVYDTKPPNTPTLGDVTALDESIRIGFTIDSDVDHVGAQLKGPADSDFVERATASSTQTSVLVKNLQDNAEYQVRLVAYDAAGNASEPTTVISAKPIQTLGFWKGYQAAGGTDPAGCSAVPSTSLFAIALALGALARSRTR